MFASRFLPRWHRNLGLAKHPRCWYRERLKEELQELRSAPSRILKLSESADVFYVLSRACHDGHQLQPMPPFKPFKHTPIYTYMVLKYSSRWLFYMTAARISASGGATQVREVINPSSDYKLCEVAARHGLGSTFIKTARCLRRVWPLLP